eukprot:scaffold28099_cov21-Tisochrysis_lutea.AAC.1
MQSHASAYYFVATHPSLNPGCCASRHKRLCNGPSAAGSGCGGGGPNPARPAYLYRLGQSLIIVQMTNPMPCIFVQVLLTIHAAVPPGMSAFAHPAMAQALHAAGVEGEVRNLLLDARSTYRKKGGVPAASIEVALKLARLTAFLRGGSGKDVQQ